MTGAPAFETRSIPVTVEKSHLIAIGEKLYTEKMSFIRELVNNAYDADATQVQITLNPCDVIVQDNGSGMDEKGLRQYFTIGSSLKKEESVSPRFRRKRIGEFGIGKFAALAACRRFEVDTQKGDFSARLLFDKEAWSSCSDWRLGIQVFPKDDERQDGTKIALCGIDDPFPPWRVRRYVAERTPIHAPDFRVILNGEVVTGEIVAGRQLPIDLQTPFGPITGRIAIAPSHARNFRFGVAVCVKGVMVRNELFGLENSRRWGVTRITGRVNADFLPITSGRDDFIRDSREFSYFHELMKKEIAKAADLLKEEGDQKANLQASRVLKDALYKIGRALRTRKNLFPGVDVPLGSPLPDPDFSGQDGFEVSSAKFVSSSQGLSPQILNSLNPVSQGQGKRQRMSGILGSKSVIRSLKVASLDIAVRLEHLGREEEESLVSGGVIYVNLDHPLYRTYRGDDGLLTLHVARIITKELTLQTGVKDVAEAFSLQSDLLKDALREKGT